MNLDTAIKHLTEEIKLRGFDDNYIDKQEEKDILKAAIAKNLTLQEAISTLHQVCERMGYTVESVIDKKATELLDQFAHNDGHVDKKEFDDTVAIIHKASQGHLSEAQCRKKTKDIIIANGWRVQEGFMKGGAWFSRI